MTANTRRLLDAVRDAGPLPDRPAVSAPPHARADVVREAERWRAARQPALGLLGLLLVIPVAAVFSIGAGGAEPSALVFGPLVTFALPVVAVIAFWWEDWPGTSLRPAWTGWFDTLLVAVGAVLFSIIGQVVVDRLDLGGIFLPSQVTAPPRTMFLAGAVFVAILQLTLVCERWPLHRLGRLVGGVTALAVAWAVGVLLYFTYPYRGLLLIGVWQVWLFVVWRGWPFGRLRRRWLRLVLANAMVIGGGLLTYTVLHDLGGLSPATVNAAAGSFIAAGLTIAMLFEGTLPNRPLRLAAVLLLAAALYFGLGAYAHSLDWTRSSAAEWVAHATLNGIGVGVILHVAIGRRWPFGNSG